MQNFNSQRKVHSIIQMICDAQGHEKKGAGTFAAQLMSVHTTAMLNSPKTIPKKNGRSR